MKALFISLGICLVVAAAFVFRPVPIPDNREDCLSVTGKVTKIWEGGVKDVVFELENDNTYYYINRGLEQGLVLEDLQNKLIGNNVTIFYPEYWTPLNPNNTSRHLTILEYNGKDIFNEIELVKNQRWW